MTCLLARLAAMERSFDLFKAARRRPGHPAAKAKNLARNPLKRQHPSATSRNPGKMHVSKGKRASARVLAKLVFS
jgi:hypothetical protein